MKKNIITKILLSSLMAPSLLASTIPIYANPIDKSVGEDKQKSTNQSVSDNKSDTAGITPSTERVLPLSSLNLTKIPVTSNDSPVFVTSLKATTPIRTNKTLHIDPLEFTAIPQTTTLPPTSKLTSCDSLKQDSKITQSEQSNSNKTNEQCDLTIEGGVLDLSSIPYDDLPRYYDKISVALKEIGTKKIHTVKFSYKQLYARAVNLKYNRPEKEYVDEILKCIEAGTIEFDHILPIAPDPYEDGFIDMSNIYSEFISKEEIKIRCDSVLVYTNPKFKIIDWITEVNRIVLEPLSQKPYKGEILKCIFNAHDEYSQYSKCSHKCEPKNVILINPYEGQNIEEDRLIIENIFNKSYGVVPNVELNKSLNPTLAKGDCCGTSKLEKHFLTNVALHIQDIDTNDLTVQRQFELVNKKTTEAVEFLRKMNGRQFFTLSPVPILRTRPSIETIVLTGEDLCKICPDELANNPYEMEILTDRINALSTNGIDTIVLNITPEIVHELCYYSQGVRRIYSFRRTDPIALEKFLDACTHNRINLKFHSLTLGFENRFNQGQPEDCLNESSNTLIRRAVAQGETLKYLYLSEFNSIPNDSIINLIPEEIRKIITPDTLIIAEVSEEDENAAKMTDLGERLHEKFGCRANIVRKIFKPTKRRGQPN